MEKAYFFTVAIRGYGASAAEALTNALDAVNDDGLSEDSIIETRLEDDDVSVPD